ncbi:MAG: dipeptidase [Gammaproteobacteria bacterium]
MFTLRYYTASLILLSFLLVSPWTFANLDRQQIDQLIDYFETRPVTGFDQFLDQLSGSAVITPETAGVATAYRNDENLNEAQSVELYRLLGIYTRLRYGDEALETLRQLVAVPTYQDENIPQHDNPQFHRFAAILTTLANDFGLSFRNIDERVYEITLAGDSEELVGFHAHADVVPVNPALWILEDGTQLDPLEVTRIGDRLYGRGTEDDKNGIVVSLYAMRVIQEENLGLLRTLRLLVDTTEETTGEAIPYYFEENPVPAYNIALDGSYPVVIAEKGFGTVMASFPVRRGSGEGAEIINLTGGLATNQIPAAATATILSAQPQQLAATLEEAGQLYRAANGANFAIQARAESDRVLLIVQGVSAHSSEPQSGVNPVSRLLDFLHRMDAQQLFKHNHITDIAHYAAVNWGLDYLGNTLGIAYSDPFMGPLTTAVTFIGDGERVLRLAVNLRLPAGKEPAELLQQIESRLLAWSEANGIDVSFDLSAAEPMHRNPEGAWVNALLDIATETLDMPREFGTSAGATSIHDLPNGVQFGLAMPDQKYTGHNANEFKRIDQFLLDLQIVTEAMATLGRMPAL